MKHKIAIEETLRRVVEVEAESPSLAVCMAEDEYNKEEHVLTSNDFIGVNITLAPEDKKAQEYLSDSAFRSYVERRFNGSSADIPLEDKARLAFGSLDNAIHDFHRQGDSPSAEEKEMNNRKAPTNRSPQGLILYIYNMLYSAGSSSFFARVARAFEIAF